MRASVNRNSVYDVDFERLRLVGCLPNPLTYARCHIATATLPINLRDTRHFPGVSLVSFGHKYGIAIS